MDYYTVPGIHNSHSVRSISWAKTVIDTIVVAQGSVSSPWVHILEIVNVAVRAIVVLDLKVTRQ